MSEETPGEVVAAPPEPLPEALAQAAGGLIVGGCMAGGRPELLTTPEQLIPLLTRLGRELPEPFSRLTDLCGVDVGDRLHVVYALCRGYTGEMILVKVEAPRRGAELPTATGLWRLAEWAEREVAEMFGVVFGGHPNPQPLLLPEGFAGHPLLKDYVYDRENPLLSPDPLREDPDTVLGTPPAEAEGGEE